jgi:hypothetical protein
MTRTTKHIKKSKRISTEEWQAVVFMLRAGGETKIANFLQMIALEQDTEVDPDLLNIPDSSILNAIAILQTALALPSHLMPPCIQIVTMVTVDWLLKLPSTRHCSHMCPLNQGR